MTAHPHERQEVYALDTPVKQSGLARRKEHQEEEEEEEEEEAKPCLDGGVFVFLHSRQDDDDDDDFLTNAKETLNALRRQNKNDGSDEYTIELQTVSSSPSVVNCSRVVVEVMNGGTKKDFTRRTEEARRALAHRVIAGRCTLMFGETSESLVLTIICGKSCLFFSHRKTQFFFFVNSLFAVGCCSSAPPRIHQR